MKHACFLTFPQTSVVPARFCSSALNQSKELIWLSKQHCQVCMIYGLFPKCEWVCDDNNCGKMCPYRYFLCRTWTCFMIRLKAEDLPFQSISVLCLHMLGRIGEAWMRIQLSRNPFTSSTWRVQMMLGRQQRGWSTPSFWGNFLENVMLTKVKAYKMLQCQTPLMSQGTASSKIVCAENSLILDLWVCWWILTLPWVPWSKILQNQ